MLLLQIVINGILKGGLYALMALGMSLIWGVMDIINIAHGSFIMLGAFTTYWLWHLMGLDPFAGLVASMVILFVLGFLIQKYIINLVIRASIFVTLILAFGIEIFINNAALVTWTADVRKVQIPYAASNFSLGEVITIPVIRLVAFVLAFAIALISLMLYVTSKDIGDDLGNPRGRTDEFIILDNNQNQRQPAVFAQINRGVGLEMRPRLFGAIAHGAKGLSFWRDYAEDVTGLPWWGDFPNIADEIDQMMDAGLIQRPHWTEWSLDTPTEGIDFGTRDLDGEGYLVAANYNDAASVVTFTLDGLDYTPVEVRDFFTDAVVATLVGNQFDVTIPANGSGVYRLVAPPSNPGDFDGDGDVDGADFLAWQRGESPGGATAGDLAEWQTHFGTIYDNVAAARAVPEPGTMLLLVAGAVFWRGIGRRRACLA